MEKEAVRPIFPYHSSAGLTALVHVEDRSCIGHKIEGYAILCSPRYVHLCVLHSIMLTIPRAPV